MIGAQLTRTPSGLAAVQWMEYTLEVQDSFGDPEACGESAVLYSTHKRGRSGVNHGITQRAVDMVRMRVFLISRGCAIVSAIHSPSASC